MSNKKIVIVSAVIFPRISPRAMRATELAKEFARKGYDVTLYGVLGTFDYRDFERKYNIRVKNLGETRFFSLNSDNGTTKLSYKQKILSKLFKKHLDYPNIELAFRANRILKKEKDIDLLITIAMPFSIHWGAAYRKTKNKNNFPKVWIADCGDPYMGNKFNKPAFYFKYIEKWFCKKTDYITIPILNAKEAYYQEFHEKIKIIPQGFDLSQSIKDINNLQIDNNVLTFIYAGTFYADVRDPRPLLEYLVSKKSLNFNFLIYTNSKGILKNYEQRLDDKLFIKDFIPRDELLSTMAKVDFLINFENNTAVQSPSKLIDYALVNKPILSINSSKGLNVKIVDEFLNKNYANSLKVGSLNKFDIRNVANQFIELM